LEKNQDKINWNMLSGNPAAIQLLEQNPSRIHWNWLCTNPSAMDLLEKNQDKIHWGNLSTNPAIFTYDYKSMTRPFTEELMAERFHPKNIERFDAWGFDA
jgi:hypothetical protein